eukprot:s4817_g2.t1
MGMDPIFRPTPAGESTPPKFPPRNAVIALYVCLNIVLVVCILAGFLLNVMGYEFGVAEAIGATIFVGLSVDYCLHLAHAYNEAPGNCSRQKIRQALVVIGAMGCGWGVGGLGDGGCVENGGFHKRKDTDIG